MFISVQIMLKIAFLTVNQAFCKGLIPPVFFCKLKALIHLHS